jgi:hypothetical protein
LAKDRWRKIKKARQRLGKLISFPKRHPLVARGNIPSEREATFGHVGAFSQVSVVFEQENPLSLDYMQRAVGSALLRPMPVHVRSQAAWGRRPVAAHL